MKTRLAVVVQRYGTEVTGGSESLARAVAERLTGDHDVTVLTTCATDYVTWRNDLPAGTQTLNGVTIVRFPSEEERDLDAFNRYSDTLYDRPHTAEDEETWLRLQGPYVPALVRHLETHRADFDAVLFFTYLYGITYWGLQAAPDHAVLVPTAHDEPPIRFGVYDTVFRLPKAFGFCSEPEEAFVRSRFDISHAATAVTGIGIDLPAAPDVEGFKIRHDVYGPYLLYAGRIDPGKGCDAMLAHYLAYRRSCRGAAELLLLGKLAMPEPRIPGVRYLGYLPEAEKFAAMAGARAVFCPSPYESLSIVLLESMGLGTPTLATARSAVLRDHCLKSNGGLVYANEAECVEAMDLLVREPRLRRALGENGRRYVGAVYRWDAVLDRYRRLIQGARGSGAGRGVR